MNILVVFAYFGLDDDIDYVRENFRVDLAITFNVVTYETDFFDFFLNWNNNLGELVSYLSSILILKRRLKHSLRSLPVMLVEDTF